MKQDDKIKLVGQIMLLLVTWLFVYKMFDVIAPFVMLPFLIIYLTAFSKGE